MFILSALTIISAAFFAFAKPVCPNNCVDNSTFLQEDIAVLNYALTLEHLENAFYRDGLANFTKDDFDSEEIYSRFLDIANHEATHVTTLETVIKSLNGTPVPECVYDFGYTDVSGFIAVARALERTGVSAYDGAIGGIHNPALLVSAASIATIEARHASYLNQISGKNPFPAAFDTPLNAKEIVSIAGGFIKSCSYDIGIVPFPKLNATLDANTNWTHVEFNKTLEQNTQFYCTWLYSAAQEQTILYSNYWCQLPKNATGDVYLFVTNSTDMITLKNDTSVVAGPAIVTVA